LYCIIERIKCKAAAPTGIAAANIELDGTKICASTIHAMFDLGGDSYESKLDFTRSQEKVQELVNTRVCLFDECSMLDNEAGKHNYATPGGGVSAARLSPLHRCDCNDRPQIWDVITKLLGLAQQRRSCGVPGPREDEYGAVHIVCFGDYKQLPFRP